jgi:hypothetical protein
MARKHRLRFGLPIVFAGRPSVGGVGLGCQPIRFAAAARFGALGSVLLDSVLPDSKSPRRIFRRGLNSCDDEDMPVICPDVSSIAQSASVPAAAGYFAWGCFRYFGSGATATRRDRVPEARIR